MQLENTKEEKSGISNFVIPITYLLLTIHFILNFLGTPILIGFYLIELVFIFGCVFTLELDRSIIPIFALFFIEGQGRILMSYNPLFRNIFDLVLIIAIMKSISIKKSIMPTSTLPHGIIFIFGFHILWYCLQVFNIFSVGIFPVLFASKIYIFPFFMFFMFLNNPISLKSLGDLLNLVLFIVIFESILSVYQMNLKEASVLSITSFYSKSLRNGIFTGAAFRPYGTSFLPGGFSTYFFLTIGLLFIVPIKSKLKKVLFAVSQILTVFSFFIMQVRSALLKHIFIMLGITLGLFLMSKFKFKSIIKFSISISILIFSLAFIPNFEQLFPDIDFESSVKRISVLQNTEEAGSQRQGGAKILNVIMDKIAETPLGLGPGRTGAAAAMGADFIYADPIYDIHSSWAWDNLMVSVVIDLGIGAIFYFLIIILLYLILVHKTFMFYHQKETQAYRVALVATISCLSILIGNWGAIGLPYNPESFVYWFLMALGLNADKIYVEQDKVDTV
jgi:hypothetical protein